MTEWSCSVILSVQLRCSGPWKKVWPDDQVDFAPGYFPLEDIGDLLGILFQRISKVIVMPSTSGPL
jgi:hypothetical protein